jgi:hypothetical protein
MRGIIGAGSVILFVRQILDMRFHLGAIPESPDFIPDGSWQLIREPSPGVWQLSAIPIGIFTAVVVAFLWFTITPLVFAMETLKSQISITGRLACLAGVLVAHELIHLAIHPMSGRSKYSILVFWPARMLVFAVYIGQMTRKRCLVMLLMPFFVISIIPLIIAAVSQVDLGWVAYASTLNALLACGDILSAGITLVKIPADTIVRCQGWKSYWRRAERTGLALRGGGKGAEPQS